MILIAILLRIFSRYGIMCLLVSSQKQIIVLVENFFKIPSSESELQGRKHPDIWSLGKLQASRN